MSEAAEIQSVLVEYGESRADQSVKLVWRIVCDDDAEAIAHARERTREFLTGLRGTPWRAAEVLHLEREALAVERLGSTLIVGADVCTVKVRGVAGR